MRTTLLIVLISMTVLALSDCASSLDYSRTAYWAGKANAQRDLANGTLGEETFGLPELCIGEYRQLVKERFGMDSHAIAGCGVDDQILGHARGYNEVMHAEIERRFGHNALDATMDDAQKLYWEKQGKTADVH